MASMFAFGLGVLVGALLSFRAGARYAIAKAAHIEAMAYMGRARTLWGGAGGALALFAAVLVGGLVIMFFAGN